MKRKFCKNLSKTIKKILIMSTCSRTASATRLQTIPDLTKSNPPFSSTLIIPIPPDDSITFFFHFCHNIKIIKMLRKYHAIKCIGNIFVDSCNFDDSSQLVALLFPERFLCLIPKLSSINFMFLFIFWGDYFSEGAFFSWDKQLVSIQGLCRHGSFSFRYRSLSIDFIKLERLLFRLN